MSVIVNTNQNKFYKINTTDATVNAIDVIRQKSVMVDVNDDPFYICNISDIIQKHRNWQRLMPRVIPFYGK